MWALAVAFDPARAGQLMMIVQACIDESYDEDGVFVLAGFIAPVQNWEAFTREWKEMLRSGVMQPDGTYQFHMTEMNHNPERMERVQWFYRVIERHVSMAMSCKIDISELKRAQRRIHIPNCKIDWGAISTPYKMALRCLMDMFHLHREMFAHIFGVDQKIDFVFDEHAERKAITDTWSEYVESCPPEMRPRYGITPLFLPDHEFLPLQAADLWAWWVRRWYQMGESERIEGSQFGPWEGLRKEFPKLTIEFNEDQLTEALRRVAANQIGPWRPVYDITFS